MKLIETIWYIILLQLFIFLYNILNIRPCRFYFIFLSLVPLYSFNIYYCWLKRGKLIVPVFALKKHNRSILASKLCLVFYFFLISNRVRDRLARIHFRSINSIFILCKSRSLRNKRPCNSLFFFSSLSFSRHTASRLLI